MAESSPRFFVEETSFHLGGIPSTDVLEQRLQDLIALIEACRGKDERLVRSKDLFDIEIFSGVSLADFLFQPQAAPKIDRLVLRTLQIALFRCEERDYASSPGSSPQVEIEGSPSQAATVAEVHGLLGNAHGAACLCLGLRADRSGVLAVRAGAATRQLHFLTERAMLPGFYRSLFEIEDLDADAYMGNAAHAFPDIAFAPGLNAQFSRFDTRYRDVRPEVTRHLAVLNDYFQDIFRQAGYAPEKTQRLLNSCHGVDASLDSPKTHDNKKAMRERDVSVDHIFVTGVRVPIVIGRPVRCEWHTKIKPNTDRIHFHPGDQEVAGGRLFVGIFHAHLTT